jgi:hypothetical protein
MKKLAVFMKEPAKNRQLERQVFEFFQKIENQGFMVSLPITKH